MKKLLSLLLVVALLCCCVGCSSKPADSPDTTTTTTVTTTTATTTAITVEGSATVTTTQKTGVLTTKPTATRVTSTSTTKSNTTSKPTTTTTAPPKANPVSDFKYGKYPDGKAVYISEYLGTAKDVVIPATIDGLPVTAISSCAFSTDTIASVYIPDTVEFIANQAFYHASNLTSVRFGSGLKTIDSQAFARCESLQEIHLPRGLTTVGSNAFAACTSVKEISIPKSVNNWGACCTFFGDYSVTSITFEEGIETIGSTQSFMNLKELETVTIPASVTFIADYIFCGCEKLKTVYFKGDAPKTIKEFAFDNLEKNPDLVIYYPKNASGWDNTTLTEHTLVAY